MLISLVTFLAILVKLTPVIMSDSIQNLDYVSAKLFTAPVPHPGRSTVGQDYHERTALPFFPVASANAPCPSMTFRPVSPTKTW